MSGAALEAEGAQFDTIKIVHLNADTPTLQAGVQVGGILERIDGKPAAQLGLSALRKMLKTEGTHQLSIIRGGKALSVSLQWTKVAAPSASIPWLKTPRECAPADDPPPRDWRARQAESDAWARQTGWRK